jgi:hypothetical protein
MLLVLLALAQPPASSPTPPRGLPPGVTPQPQQAPETLTGPPAGAEPSLKLPHPEALVQIPATNTYPGSLRVEQTPEGWVVRIGTQATRQFGPDQQAANALSITARDLRVNQWGMIGNPRPVVEYGLLNGVAPPVRPNAKVSLPIDLKSVRAEPVRGVWTVRDDANILLNFGPDQVGAEQAAAVAKKYGFNRVGANAPQNPGFVYLYTDRDASRIPQQTNRSNLPAELQEQSMTRTGVPVAGGFVGDRQVIDARKLEVRKDRGEWVLAHGPDVFARFGQSDWTARDALKVAKDCRFTEVCRVGGLTFFLVNGSAPTRVPFSAKGTTFNPAELTVRPADGKWGVGERTGRTLFTAPTEAEAKQIVQVITAYKFDTVCRVGLGSKDGLQFLAKTGSH